MDVFLSRMIKKREENKKQIYFRSLKWNASNSKFSFYQFASRKDQNPSPSKSKIISSSNERAMRKSVRIKRAYQVQKSKLRRSLSMEDGCGQAINDKNRDTKGRKIVSKMPFDQITKSVNPSLTATHLFIGKHQEKKTEDKRGKQNNKIVHPEQIPFFTSTSYSIFSGRKISTNIRKRRS